jgi:succinoglycan biosynthesis transport protein ExoP
MTLSQLMLLLRARHRIIARTTLILLIAAATLYLLFPPSYRATTALVLNYKAVDPSTGSGQLANYVTTQMDVIRSMGVARQVVDSLRLAEQPRWQEQFAEKAKGRGDIKEWLAERMLKKLDVVPGRDSAVLKVSIKDENPQFAATAANAFARAYEDTQFQLKASPLRSAATHFSEHLAGLRENLAQAQTRLSQYRKEKGITSEQAHLDVESERLNELSRQLVLVQVQLMEERSGEEQAQGRQAAQSPQVLADPLTHTLKAQLNEAEARLAELSKRYTELHPQYQAAQAEVNRSQRALRAHVRTAAAGIENQARMLQQRASELSRAVEIQGEKVLALNQSRDELLVMNKEMEDAQRAYDAASKRMMEANIEGFTPPEVAVLSVATPPVKPSGPGLPIWLAAAALLGMVAGAGLALLAELRDRRVRSAADLLELAGLPVLGEVGTISSKGRAHATPPLLRRSQMKLENGSAA